MRKIEQAMIAAICQGKNWQSGNTMVDRDTVTGDTLRVWLHGNLIATLRGDTLSFTLAGWPTPTTRSRVNALLREFIHANAGVGQEAGRQYFWGPTTGMGSVLITAREWVQA